MTTLHMYRPLHANYGESGAENKKVTFRGIGILFVNMEGLGIISISSWSTFIIKCVHIFVRFNMTEIYRIDI